MIRSVADRRLLRAAVAVAVAVGVSACGGDDAAEPLPDLATAPASAAPTGEPEDSGDPGATSDAGTSDAPTPQATDPSAPPSETPTDGADDAAAAEAAALAAFETYVDDYAAVLADPTDASLQASDAATERGVEEMAQAGAGLAGRDRRIAGDVAVEPQIRVQGPRATVEGCLDQSATELTTGSGEPVERTEADRIRVGATLVLDGDTWLVDEFAVRGDRPC